MLLIGKPSINGPFSMAMLNNQRGYNLQQILESDVQNPQKMGHVPNPLPVISEANG